MDSAVLIPRPGVEPDNPGAGGATRSEELDFGRREALVAWLAAQPLVPPAVGLVAGITVDAACRIPFAACLFVFALCGWVVVRFRQADGVRHLAIGLAALAVGAALHALAFRHWPDDHIVRYCGEEPVPARLIGTVLDTPVIRPVQTGRIDWYWQSPRTRMLVSAEAVQGETGMIPVSGTVSVMVREPVLHVTAGDRVELFGILQRPKAPTHPGERNWRLYQRRNGVLVQMTCQLSANVAVQAVGRHDRRWIAWLRRQARLAMLEGMYPEDLPGSQLLEAMVLAQRSAVSPALNEAFTRTGTVHYLSVSGAHVGMLASVVWLIGWLVGRPARSVCIAVMVFITLYAVLAEPRPPILRAAMMGNLLCLAILMRRPVRTANWLAAAALLLLAAEPMQLFSAGFQLSFLTLIALIYLSPRVYRLGKDMLDSLLGRDDPLLQPRIQRMLGPIPLWRRIGWWMETGLGWPLSISISAWLAGLLPSAYHFQQLPLWGWMNTLLVLPLVWLTLVLGLGKTVLAVVAEPAAGVIGMLLMSVTNGLIGLVDYLAVLPGAGIAVPAVPLPIVLGGLAVLAGWAVLPWLRVSGHWIALAGLAFLTLAAWRLAPPGQSDTLRIFVLSVGHGTATVIHLPNGRTLVYDMGSRPPYDVERWTAGPLLARDRVWRIDAFILSHLHLDHFSSLPDLLHRRWVAALVRPPDQGDQMGPAARLLEEVCRKGASWQTAVRGDRLTGTGDVLIEVLWPPAEGDQRMCANDRSIVLSITHRGRRVLLCGDIEQLAQQELLDRENLKADVLALPHHGAVVNNTAAFIHAVDPAWCVRSTGYRDTQSRRLIDIMSGYGYLSTAEHGTLEIEIGPNDLRLRPWGRGEWMDTAPDE